MRAGCARRGSCSPGGANWLGLPSRAEPGVAAWSGRPVVPGKAGPIGPPAGVARRPGQVKLATGPGHADMEQPLLLGQLAGGTGVGRGDRPVAQSDDEDHVSLETLGRCRLERANSLGAGAVRTQRQVVDLAQQRRGKRGTRASGEVSTRSRIACCDCPRVAAAPCPAGGRSSSNPTPARIELISSSPSRSGSARAARPKGTRTARTSSRARLGPLSRRRRYR